MIMNQDLTVDNPSKVLRRFCIPLFASVLFQQLYNIADSFVAGRFIGENALAAVGNSYEITLIYIAFAFGCNMGCSVTASHYFGAHDMKRLKTAISTSVIVSAATCLTLMVLGFLTADLLLGLIRTPADVYADSKLYLDIYIMGLPFLFFYNISTGIFSALGDSRTPFWFLAFSSTANILVDILFVTKLHMGVAGVAWATFLCQGVSCVLAVITVIRRLSGMKTEEKPALFSVLLFRRFLSVAVPSLLQQSFISVGNIILQGAINGFGPGVMAGYSAAVKMNNLVITSFTTLGNGISNYTAQNMGAGKLDRVRAGFSAGLRMVWVISAPIMILYFFGGEALLRLFIDAPTELSIISGMQYLRILAPFYPVISAKLVVDGILKGSGLMNRFMVVTFTDLLLRVVLALMLCRTSLGYLGIWCAWPIGWTTACIISMYYYRTGPWFADKAKSI